MSVGLSVTLSVPPHADDHSQGSPSAVVTVLEYGDFECPSCKTAATTPTLLMDRFPGSVRFVYRHFPLEDAHPHALRAAEASEAAAAQQRFWPMYDILFQNQTHLEDSDLYDYAMDIGLEPARYMNEMANHVHLAKVNSQLESGRHSRIRATPTFFIDGILHDVSFGMQRLHDAVAVLVAEHTRGTKEKAP